MRTISPNMIRQLFVLLLIVVIGGLIFRELLPYFSGVLGAITMYVLMRRWMVGLVRRGWNSTLAAAVLILFSFIVILLPVLGIVSLLGNKIGNAVQNSEKVATAFKDSIGEYRRTVWI